MVSKRELLRGLRSKIRKEDRNSDNDTGKR